MILVSRYIFFPGFALSLLMASGLGQSTTPINKTIHSVVQDLETHPEGYGPHWAGELDGPVNSASIAEITQELPALIALTESSNPQLRGNALLLLYGIAGRQRAGLPENRGERDLLADEAIVPYISRLAPRFTDPSTSNRSLTLILFQALGVVRPTPPQLLKVALTVLQDPQSTHATPDTTGKSPTGEAPSLGPQVLWVLLSADATFHRDPVTNLTEGQDSPEVQQAIVTFLRRPDQTAESLTETVRALALAQVQNPAVNAELLRLLDSTDPIVQRAILSHIATLALTPENFASAHARVSQLATSAATRPEIQRLARALLVCWSNDRHHDVCPLPEA